MIFLNNLILLSKIETVDNIIYDDLSLKIEDNIEVNVIYNDKWFEYILYYTFHEAYIYINQNRYNDTVKQILKQINKSIDNIYIYFDIEIDSSLYILLNNVDILYNELNNEINGCNLDQILYKKLMHIVSPISIFISNYYQLLYPFIKEEKYIIK